MQSLGFKPGHIGQAGIEVTSPMCQLYTDQKNSLLNDIINKVLIKKIDKSHLKFGTNLYAAVHSWAHFSWSARASLLRQQKSNSMSRMIKHCKCT